MRISERLKIIAKQIEPGSIVADIGTDHAYLPTYLIRTGISPRVIGVEVNSGPFKSAVEQVKAAGLGGQIEIRMGDGFSGIKPGEVQVAVLAGMGGKTICNLLEVASPVLLQLKRLVLQPIGAALKVREWLWQHGWQIIHEDLFQEGHLFYPIITAEPDPDRGEEGALKVKKPGAIPQMFSEVEREIGPDLIRTRHPILPAYLQVLLLHKERILAQLKKGRTARAEAKQIRYSEQIKELKRLLADFGREKF